MENVQEEWRNCEVTIIAIFPLKEKKFGDSRDWMGKGYVFVPQYDKDDTKPLGKPLVKKVAISTNLGFLHAPKRHP